MKLHETTYEIAYVRVAISLYLWLRSRPMEHSRSYKWHVHVSAKPNARYNAVFFIYFGIHNNLVIFSVGGKWKQLGLAIIVYVLLCYEM